MCLEWTECSAANRIAKKSRPRMLIVNDLCKMKSIAAAAKTIARRCGLNVNIGKFPPELADRTTSIRLETGRTCSVSKVENLVRSSLQLHYEILQKDGLRAIIQLWRSRDYTTGFEFSTIVEGRRVAGRARGIADNGAIILELGSGELVEDFNASAAKG